MPIEVRLAGVMNSFRALSLALCMLLVSSCLPDDSASLSSGSEAELQSLGNTPQQIIENYSNNFVNASRSVQLQAGQTLAQSDAFVAGNLSVGEINLAALGIDAPANMKAAYCEMRQPDGTTKQQIITWTQDPAMDPVDPNAMFSLNTGALNAGEKVLNAAENIDPSMQVGISKGQAVSVEIDGAQVDLNLSGCGVDIPPGTPVALGPEMSDYSDEYSGQTSVYEYLSEACPDGQVGTIVRRRTRGTPGAVAQATTPAGVDYDFGPWEDFQDSCMEVVNQLDTGQVAVQIFAEQQPGDVQGLDVAEVITNLDNKDCLRPTTGGMADPVNGNDTDEECVSDTVLQAIELENPTGSDLEETNNVVDAEIIQDACPVGDQSQIAGYVNGYAGLVDVGGGWQGTMEFARYYNEVINTLDENDATGLNHRNQWAGHSLLCTRDETLRVTCDTAYPQYNGPTYVPVDTQGYMFDRQNQIDGWQDAANFVPNDPLPNDVGWAFQNGNCSWNESINFDNVPASYTPTVPGGGNYQRLIEANNIDITPVIGDWFGVAPSIGTRVEQSTAPCPAGFVGAGVITTTSYTSSAEFPWDTPTVTSTSSVDNQCTCNPEVEVQTVATTCPDGSDGSENQERQRQCPSGAWGGWQTTGSTCPSAAPAGSGATGPVCGTSLNSCLQGTFRNAYQTDRNWWECYTGAGTTACASDANCIHCQSALATTPATNGVCGPADGTATNYAYNSPPPSNQLCSVGNATSLSSVANTTIGGRYLWTCLGINGGSNASCSASYSGSAGAGGNADCYTESVSWGGNCNGMTGDTVANDTETVSNVAGGYTGSATFQCSGGNYVLQNGSCNNSSSSCDPDYQAVCGSASGTCVCGIAGVNFTPIGTSGYQWACQPRLNQDATVICTGQCPSGQVFDAASNTCNITPPADNLSCGSQSIRWGNFCGRSNITGVGAGDMANGATRTVVDDISPDYDGTADIRCNAGTWVVDSYTCTPNGSGATGADCTAQRVEWGNGC